MSIVSALQNVSKAVQDRKRVREARFILIKNLLQQKV